MRSRFGKLGLGNNLAQAGRATGMRRQHIKHCLSTLDRPYGRRIVQTVLPKIPFVGTLIPI